MQTSYIRQYPSIYRGIVESNKDPKNLGRCKIRVPSVHGELLYPVDLLPWARPIASSAVNSSRGSVNVPDEKDIVWVFFEGAMKDYPVYFGGTYANGDIVASPDKVVIYQEGTDSIVYDRTLKSYTIQVNDNLITMDDTGVSIDSDKSITLKSRDKFITIDNNSNVLSLRSGDNVVTLSDDHGLVLNSSNRISITAPDVNISCDNLNLNYKDLDAPTIKEEDDE